MKHSTVSVWRLPRGSPILVALPSDVPGGVITRLENGRARIHDPHGYLTPGEYSVYEPGPWEPRGRILVNGPEGVLLEGTARLWWIAGPPPWWREALDALEQVLAALRPATVATVPYYQAPRRFTPALPAKPVLLVPSQSCGGPRPGPWGTPTLMVCPGDPRWAVEALGRLAVGY